MRLYHQLVLFMLAATVLPLASVGFWLLRQSEQELSRRIGSEQEALAAAAAQSAASELFSAVNAISRSAALIRAEGATPEEQKGVLSLLYGQSLMVSAAVWVDPEKGASSSPVFLASARGGHPGFEPQAGVRRLLSAIPPEPLAGLSRGEVALSAAYLHSQGEMGALAVAVKLADGAQGPFALVELGLASLEEGVASRASPPGRIDLIDGAGRVLASSEPQRRLSPVPPELWEPLAPRLEEHAGFTLAVGQGKSRQQVSVARLPQGLGLFALATVEEAEALAPVRSLRRTVLLAVGGAVGLLLLLGSLFTRRLNRRLSRVSQGALAYAEGDLSRRIPVEGEDELSELSQTFNQMGGELESARARLTRWNDELKERVEEATAELKAAQEKLVEAQKLAAIGQLGAGVAHEINNPLCGILGNTQLLMLDRQESDPDFETLRKIEQSAKRCKEITQNLLRFAQSQSKGELRPLDLNALARDAVSASSRQCQAEGVAVTTALWPGSLMVHGDPAQLSHLIAALLSNARIAMAKSPQKSLTLATREEGEEVVLEVKDTGKGIRPEHLPRIFEPFFTTKDLWSNVGLGLSIAYRIAKEHQGRLEVATELGKGSAFLLRAPKLSPGQPGAAPRAESRPALIGGKGVGITG